MDYNDIDNRKLALEEKFIMDYNDWYSWRHNDYPGERIKRAVRIFKHVSLIIFSIVFIFSLISLGQAFAEAFNESDENFASFFATVIVFSFLPQVLGCVAGMFLVWFVSELLYGWGEHVGYMSQISRNLATIAKQNEEKNEKKDVVIKEKTFRKNLNFGEKIKSEALDLSAQIFEKGNKDTDLQEDNEDEDW